MAKKVKILEGTRTPDLEKKINELLKKGWGIRGSITQGVHCLVVMMEK